MLKFVKVTCTCMGEVELILFLDTQPIGGKKLKSIIP